MGEKDTEKQKKKLIEPEAILAEMEELERWNGSYSPEKVAENWYELKKRLLEVIAARKKEDD